ncbi:hypothetical protein AVEN_267643-1 [Araneus ventricosus]|uniref:Uncharacterized protein n=1 Tax=Araneus ventricosus TaxID=182803 RepID=A0A4Y2PKN3_ARAVE|nr:hypothetical protein AVEN_267643-1 [Araneus ventricosus]
MFQFQIRVPALSVVKGCIVDGVVYWKAKEICMLMGYDEDTNVVRMNVQTPLTMGQLVPKGRYCAIPKRSKMLTTQQVLDLCNRLHKPRENFVHIFSKILTEPLKSDIDICRLLSRRQSTFENPVLFHLGSKRGLTLKNIVERLSPQVPIISSSGITDESDQTSSLTTNSNRISRLEIDWNGGSMFSNIWVFTTDERRYQFSRVEEGS